MTPGEGESDLASTRRVRYPSLYQVNTRVWLGELSRSLDRPATLDDIPDPALDHLAHLGFDWVWFLGVWQTGAAGRQVSLSNLEWRREFQDLLPDLSDADICGSCFAITGYTVHAVLGGNTALERLRQRLHDRGLRLLLDFVPNHTAPDHPWVQEHHEFYVQGTESDLTREPHNYCWVQTPRGPVVLAYGRDPYFPGWPDTLQLNYGHPPLQEAMRAEVSKIAELCDGVRCDMAMLILPEVFQRTWGVATEPFWPQAIQRVRQQHSEFLFMAEVYWDLEWTLQQQDFDYTYDKPLYDRLRDRHARPVRDHFRADMVFQRKLARFLENHDEPRAAETFPTAVHRAAAVLTFLCPGLRFFHQGQFEGRRKRIPVHLCRRPAEPLDQDLQEFYECLLISVCHPAVQDGEWQLLDCTSAWEGNWTSDDFIAFAWQGQGGQPVLVTVNYAGNPGQCYVRLPFHDLRGGRFCLQDLMSAASYDREGDSLLFPGLYLDMPAWGYHVFELRSAP
jgi:hypothetical protein